MTKIHILAVGIFVLSSLVFSKIQYTYWPELQLWPYLMKEGHLLYKDIAFEKTPLLAYLLLVWTSLFGNTIGSIKVLTWIIIGITGYVVYLYGKRVFKSTNQALWAVFLYVLLAAALDGNGLWFDLLIGPLMMASHMSLMSSRIMMASALFGLALTTKQTAIVYIFPLAVAIYKLPKYKLGVSLKKFMLSLLVIGSIPILYFTYLGVVDEMFVWLVEFAPTLSKLSAQNPSFSYFILIVLIILLYVLLWKNYRMISLMGIISLVFLFPRFEVFHFQPTIPFLSIAIVAVAKTKSNLGKALVVLILIFSLKKISVNFGQADRFYDQSTLDVSVWIKINSSAREKIYIYDAWDSIYALSGTLPAISPWVHYLPWYLEFPGVRDSIIQDLKETRPKYIITQRYDEKADNTVEQFIIDNYRMVRRIGDTYEILEPK
jgi:hypothetical protein